MTKYTIQLEDEMEMHALLHGMCISAIDALRREDKFPIGFYQNITYVLMNIFNIIEDDGYFSPGIKLSTLTIILKLINYVETQKHEE